jgi:hypothetical protein
VYTTNEILFPHSAIAALKMVRGPQFTVLVERILKLPETHEETLAFMYMMIQLDGCMGCETDSFRAMKGCGACAIQTLRRFKGGDEELIAAYEQALYDVRAFATQNLQTSNDGRVIEFA